MKNLFLTASVAFLMITSGCSVNSSPDSLGPDKWFGVQGNLCINNDVASNVKFSHQYFKAHYYTLKYLQLPPDKILHINQFTFPAEPPAPVFIRCVIPGGEVVELLSHKDCTGITKYGKEPIRCLPLPLLTNREIHLVNWNMEDLSSLIGKIPPATQGLILDVTPADGLLDWSVISRFSANIGWRFRNVSRFVNANKANVKADFIVFDGCTVVLPAGLECKSVYLSSDNFISDGDKKRLEKAGILAK